MRLFMKQMFVIIRCMIIVQVNIKGNLNEFYQPKMPKGSEKLKHS